MDVTRRRWARPGMAAAVALGLTVAAGCGKKAPPFLTVRTPEPVFESVTALPARGGVAVAWTEVPELPVPPTKARWWGYRVMRRVPGASPEELRTVRLAGSGGRRYEILDLEAPAGELGYTVELVSDDRRVAKVSPEAGVDRSAEPVPPGGLSAAAGDGRVDLAWEPGPAAGAAYHVFRGPPGGAMDRQRPLNPSPLGDPAWSDVTVVNGAEYCWSVSVSVPTPFGRAESPLSAPVCATPADATPPGPPKGLNARQGGGRVLLEWEESTENDVAGYRVWSRRGAEERFVLRSPVPVRSPRFQDDSPPAGERWQWVVTAVDAAGNESPFSETVILP